MRRRRVHTRFRIVIPAVLVAGLAVGAIAYATIPNSNVIQGCYDSGGNVKVVQALPCPKGYTPLAWNQQGPPGINGSNGTPGAKGDKGDKGDPGAPALPAPPDRREPTVSVTATTPRTPIPSTPSARISSSASATYPPAPMRSLPPRRTLGPTMQSANSTKAPPPTSVAPIWTPFTRRPSPLSSRPLGRTSSASTAPPRTLTSSL